jgi:SSS family solute:Na+ symporter
LNGLLFALLAYVAVQLAMGAWVSRRIRTEADYLVAGRNLGPIMATSSIFATWFGAETCVGAAGEVYEHGLGAVSSDPFGYGLCLLLFGLFLASPLYQRGLITLADLFRSRFSQGVERTVAFIIIPSSLLWAAAQVRAFGHVLSSGAGIGEDTGILIATGVGSIYTVFGGMLADAYADLINGGILVVCLGVLAVVVVGDAGGVGPTLSMLSRASDITVEPQPFLVTLNDWAVPVLGSLFAQELVSRVVASRSQRVARNSTLVASLVYVAVGSIPVLLGAIAHATMPGANSEQVLSTLALKHMHTVGYVLFAGALVSAILSTVDSALLVCGSLVSHNLAPMVRSNLSDTQRVRIARVSVFAFGILAYVLARSGESVHALVELASSFGSAGVCVAALLGLFTRRGGPRAALACVLAGAVGFAHATYLLESEIAFLLSLVWSAAAYGAVAVWERTVEPSGEAESA